MSTSLMLHILEHSSLRGSAKLLLLAIASFARDDGTGATPSVATLSRIIGTKTRYVQYLLRELEQSGDLICDYHAGPDGCNRYTVVIPSFDESAPEITDVHWDADPPVLPPAPPAHHSALQGDAAPCAQLKEGKKDGGGGHAHPRKHEGAPIPTPPGERPLHADPFTLWRTGRVIVHSLDEAQLAALAAELDEPTGGFGPYWLGRAILAANICDAQFATNPRALNLVRAILRRWAQEQSFGSDTRDYQSKQEHRHDHTRPPEQRLATPRGRAPYQHDRRTTRSHAPTTSRSLAVTACTIIGYDPERDG